MYRVFIWVTTTLLMPGTTSAYPEFVIHGSDIRANEPIAKRHLGSGIGCDGQNISPRLRWTSGPSGTKSYAVTAVDRDSSDSGKKYHWIVLNIPLDWSGIPRGQARNSNEQSILQLRTDTGHLSWDGPCATSSETPHRYVFTVYALNVSKLEISSDTDASVVDEALARHVIAASSVTAIHPSWGR